MKQKESPGEERTVPSLEEGEAEVRTVTDHVVLASFTPRTSDFLPSMCEALAGEMCRT